jgi:hypothetical protein
LCLKLIAVCLGVCLVGIGSVEELVEELEGGWGFCVECKMCIADIVREYR